MLTRPLKQQYFQILLALSRGELHGYAIQRAVMAQTDDQIKLWPAMLYRSLAKLEEASLIAPTEAPADEPDDERRQYYRLTSAGEERLQDEADLLSRWVDAARSSAS